LDKIITDKSGFVCSRESDLALTIFDSDVDVALGPEGVAVLEVNMLTGDEMIR
jgi:hypothetical protein